MKIKQQLTLDDIIDICEINFEGVKEAIIQIASESKCVVDFYKKFEEYYSEYGLGGNDRWEDCKAYLWLILDGPYRC